jgi:hypothetical protein
LSEFQILSNHDLQIWLIDHTENIIGFSCSSGWNRLLLAFLYSSDRTLVMYIYRWIPPALNSFSYIATYKYIAIQPVCPLPFKDLYLLIPFAAAPSFFLYQYIYLVLDEDYKNTEVYHNLSLVRITIKFSIHSQIRCKFLPTWLYLIRLWAQTGYVRL